MSLRPVNSRRVARAMKPAACKGTGTLARGHRTGSAAISLLEDAGRARATANDRVGGVALMYTTADAWETQRGPLSSVRGDLEPQLVLTDRPTFFGAGSAEPMKRRKPLAQRSGTIVRKATQAIRSRDGAMSLPRSQPPPTRASEATNSMPFVARRAEERRRRGGTMPPRTPRSALFLPFL
jgi:hypothetical protein